MIIQIQVTKTVSGTSTQYDYPIDMTQVKNVQPTRAMTHVIGEVEDDFILVDGTSLGVYQEIVPHQITKTEAKIALNDFNLYDMVIAIINDPATPFNTKIAWDDALVFKRESPLLTDIANALAMTEDEVDDLFRYAAKIYTI